MAGTSDQVFLRAFRWFQSAVDFLHGQIPSAALADPLAGVLRTGLGLALDKTAATIDPSAFAATRAAAESLALATLVTGETVAALKTLGEVLSDLQAGNAGLDDLVKVIRQIDRILGAQPGRFFSADGMGGLVNAPLATPVPEPGTYALLMVGLSLLGTARWRAKKRTIVAETPLARDAALMFTAQAASASTTARCRPR